MTAEDGFVLKQGEGREGKDPLQGFLRAGKIHGAGGMQKGPWALRGNLLPQNFCCSFLPGKSENRTVLALPGEAAAKLPKNFYIYGGIFYPETRWFLIKGEKSFTRGQWNKSGRNVKSSNVKSSVMASPGGTTFTLASVMGYVVEKQLSIKFSNYLYDLKLPS